MLDRKSIVVFDFETTGLSATQNEILEIGAIKYEKIDGKFEIVEELSAILHTDEMISEKITEITGITTEYQRLNGISQAEGFHRLDNLISSDSLLIAYNIQFDLGFITNFYHKNFDSKFKVENDILDVMAIYKDRNKYPHRLESAVKQYSIQSPNTHRALDDCKATYELLVKLAEELPNINKYINVIGYNKKYGVSGLKLPHVKYVAQYGGYREIEKL